MRTTKFRAFDRVTKKMYPVVEIQFRLDYREDVDGPVSGITVDTGDGHEVLLNYDLVEYTGLKAKGKEIYEGDIITIDDDGEYFDLDGKEKVIVYWEKEALGFWIKNLDGSEKDMEWNPFTAEPRIEIIGNIYEDKDLLK